MIVSSIVSHHHITMQDMDTYMYLCLALVLFLYLPGIQGQIITNPENEYHLLSDTSFKPMLNCKLDEQTESLDKDYWYDCRDVSPCELMVENDGEFRVAYRDDYTIDTGSDGSEYNLQVETVEYAAAGGYQCSSYRDVAPPEPQTYSSYARLLLIGTDPECTMSSINDPPMAGDVVQLHYWVEYARPDEFKPKVTWTTSPEDLQVTGTGPLPPDNSGPFNYTYVSTITLSRNHIEITVTCSTVFELDDDDAPGDYDARNEVKYEHDTSFTITEVQIPPENATTVISTEEGVEINDGYVLNPNDKLICDDETANPPPSVTWTQDPGPPVLDGDNKLVIEEGMIGNDYIITCTATNTIHFDDYTGYRAVNISVAAIPTNPTSTTTTTTTGKDTTNELVNTTKSTAAPGTEEEGGGLEGWAIAIIVVCCLLAILAIVLLIYWFFCRNRKKDSDEHKPSNNTSYPGNQADVVRNTGAADHQNNTEPFQPYGNIYNSDKNPRKKKKVPTATLR